MLPLMSEYILQVDDRGLSEHVRMLDACDEREFLLVFCVSDEWEGFLKYPHFCPVDHPWSPFERLPRHQVRWEFARREPLARGVELLDQPKLGLTQVQRTSSPFFMGFRVSSSIAPSRFYNFPRGQPAYFATAT